MDSNAVREGQRTVGLRRLRILFSSEETPQKSVDYQPVFFEGRPLWTHEPLVDRPLTAVLSNDERQQAVWSSARVRSVESSVHRHSFVAF